MSLKTRLIFLQVPITLMVVAVSLIAWKALNIDTRDLLVGVEVRQLSLELELTGLKIERAFRNYENDKKNNTEKVELVKTLLTERKQILEKYGVWVHSGEVFQRLTVLSDFLQKEVTSVEEKMIFLAETKNGEGISVILQNEYLPLVSKESEMMPSREISSEQGSRVEVDHVFSVMRHSAYLIIFSLIFGNLVLGAAIWLLATRLSHYLMNVIGNLKSASKEIGQATQTVSSTSVELSSTSTQQSSALVETSAALTQMSAMVSKTAENSKTSSQKSEQSLALAFCGKTVIEELTRSVDEIQKSNEHVTEEIQLNNKKFNTITRLISEVREKTKIINDIVFQTKLLAFNAAIEAARAGEVGKGFAVVADEVAELSEKSGAAANEISKMLEDSIKKIGVIIDDSAKQIDQLMAESKEKILLGKGVGVRCTTLFDDILNAIESVFMTASEIATATEEQSKGVHEITRAMDEMTQGLTRNSTLSESVAVVGQQLAEKSIVLENTVLEISKLTSGAKPLAPKSEVIQVNTVEAVLKAA